MLETDAPFVDDGTRVYKTPEQRERFNRIARDTLALSRTNFIEISGSWDDRFASAVAAVDALIQQSGREPRLVH
jgi:nicotinamide riboside kinase